MLAKALRSRASTAHHSLSLGIPFRDGRFSLT